MKKRKTRKWFAIVVIAGVLVGLPGWRIHVEMVQQQKNRELVAAVKRHDVQSVRALLERGASANAQDLPPDNRSMLQIVQTAFSRSPKPEPDRIAPAVLQTATEVIAPQGLHLIRARMIRRIFINPRGGFRYDLDDENKPSVEESDIFAIVELLLKHGADPNTPRVDKNSWGIDGATPLVLMTQYGNTHLVKLLLDAGASPNTKSTNTQNSALWNAVGYKQYDTCALLLARGADTEIADGIGATPLILAARADDIKMVQLLLKRGARVDVIDNTKETPLSCATGNKNATMAALLKRAGARK